MLKIIENSNIDKYEEVTKAVKDNDGFCPCELIKNNDTKCICKAFREQENTGECHCGRYIKIEIKDDYEVVNENSNN